MALKVPLLEIVRTLHMRLGIALMYGPGCSDLNERGDTGGDGKGRCEELHDILGLEIDG